MPKHLTIFFPLLAIVASWIAWQQPHWFSPFGSWIVPILMLIMFAMGLTLSMDDFRRVIDRKLSVLLGLVIQFSIMPFAAYALSQMLGLSDELTIGMILVGAASGGTASNVICYLARADVALSISMTLASTIVAVVALPALSWLYLGEVVPVPVGAMFVSVLKIVLLPLLVGLLLNHFVPRVVQSVIPFLPIVTTAAIIFVIAIIVALNQKTLASISMTLVVAVVLHNFFGLLTGYWLARLLGQSEITSRTIAIEVGMQNSGLAVALAVKYFLPLSALPGALFSIWHNISGSLLAAYWSREKSAD